MQTLSKTSPHQVQNEDALNQTITNLNPFQKKRNTVANSPTDSGRYSQLSPTLAKIKAGIWKKDLLKKN